MRRRKQQHWIYPIVFQKYVYSFIVTNNEIDDKYVTIAEAKIINMLQLLKKQMNGRKKSYKYTKKVNQQISQKQEAKATNNLGNHKSLKINNDNNNYCCVLTKLRHELVKNRIRGIVNQLIWSHLTWNYKNNRHWF